MKQFIYLDTDIVNSIIAQKDKGLVSSTELERLNSKGTDKTKSGEGTLDLSVEGGIWKFAKAQAELIGSGTISVDNHSQTALREIATKTLHDAAFDIAHSYIRDELSSDISSVDLGDYVELTQVFDFVDFSYMEGLVSKESGIMELIKRAEKEKIEAAYDEQIAELSDEINREQRRKIESEIKAAKRLAIQESDSGTDNTAEMIRIIRRIIPYNRMLVSPDGYIVPLEDKYFRDNPQVIGFKHGGHITCIGYVTNIIGNTSSSNSSNVFSQFQSVVNDILVSILQVNNSQIYILHPIAIYYGE